MIKMTIKCRDNRDTTRLSAIVTEGKGWGGMLQLSLRPFNIKKDIRIKSVVDLVFSTTPFNPSCKTCLRPHYDLRSLYRHHLYCGLLCLSVPSLVGTKSLNRLVHVFSDSF